MTTAAMRSHAPGMSSGSAGFGPLLWAEWIKFRTVRGWVIGMLVAALVTVGIALLNHSSCGGTTTPGGPVVTGTGCAAPPVGPGGEPVADNFYFVHRPLSGPGSITVRMTALTAAHGPTALQPWSKAGIIIAASTRPGSAYAAMMVTAGHGVRMQYNYTGDIAGLPGTVSAASPRWLRLTRSGNTLTGYQSVDGTHWSVVGSVHLAGLPATVQAGMLAASPVSSQSTAKSVSGSSSSGAITLAAARFDRVLLGGRTSGGGWTGRAVGAVAPGMGFHRAGGIITVTGSGDIAPYVAAVDGAGTAMEQTLLGAAAGLIAVIIVAAMFMTAEYRRGLIRVTFAASPRRGQVLAAKAIVIGSVTFAAGLAGSIAAVIAGEWLLRANGNVILPVSTFTAIRAVAGTAALLAVAAVLALALGAVLRSGASAVTTVIATIFLPYLLALTFLPPGASAWLLRLTPAAGFAIQQTTPAYSQVAAAYTPGNGYFPLSPWAGFGVLCGYAAVTVVLAVILLRKRDA
jgi:ABC-type transport system involved in multi-copper enzyme maturation permease subunit